VSAEGAVRWIARLEEAEPWFVSAHPGEGRDPDRMAERVGRGALIDLQPYAPYDLGPGIRRDERKREGERGMLQAPPAPTVWIARHADAARVAGEADGGGVDGVGAGDQGAQHSAPEQAACAAVTLG
jgi:hypothetical protein